MSDFRIHYGSAVGPYGNAAAGSGEFTFTSGDTTPDVTSGTFFITNNTSATTITYFDVLGPGGVVSTAHHGKLLKIFVQDNNTTFANAAQLFLASTGGVVGSGRVLNFVYFNSGWYEDGAGSAVAREEVKSVTITGASAAPNVTNTRVLIVSNTGGGSITGLSGGAVGQAVYLMKNIVAAGSAITLTGGPDFLLAGTASLVMSASSSYLFVSDNGTRFRQVGGATQP